MNVDVKINRIVPDGGNLKAYASLNFDGVFAVHGIKVLEGKNGMFISMPTQKSGDKYHDVCYPVTKEFREELNNRVIGCYHQTIEQLQTQNQGQNENFDEAEQVSAIKMAM